MARAFARVQRADTAPGDCIRCGRDEDLLDLGVDNEFLLRGYGTPRLCTVCFAELADNMNLILRSDADAELEAQRQMYLREIAGMKAQPQLLPSSVKINEFRERVISDVQSAIDRAARDFAGSRDPVAVDSVESTPVVEHAAVGDGSREPDPARPASGAGVSAFAEQYPLRKPDRAAKGVFPAEPAVVGIWDVLAQREPASDDGEAGDVAGGEGSDRVLAADIEHGDGPEPE